MFPATYGLWYMSIWELRGVELVDLGPSIKLKNPAVLAPLFLSSILNHRVSNLYFLLELKCKSPSGTSTSFILVELCGFWGCCFFWKKILFETRKQWCFGRVERLSIAALCQVDFQMQTLQIPRYIAIYLTVHIVPVYLSTCLKAKCNWQGNAHA